MKYNSYKNQKLRGLKRKLEIIKIKGGKCQTCGYCKNISALEFHHEDPLLKEFQVDIRRFSNTSLKKLKTELDKCILLCSNCHRETHNQDLNMIIVEETVKTINKSSFNNPLGGMCLNCNTTFKKIKGKKYCSDKCRIEVKNLPTLNEINLKYNELKSWEKVANSFNVTRRIIQGIRKKLS